MIKNIQNFRKELINSNTRTQKVLDSRLAFPNSSLADLHEPSIMQAILTKAHYELIKVVDLAYRPQPFTTEAKRMEFFI